MFLKKIIIPDGTKEIDAVITWVVSWTRRYGCYSGDVEKCYQVFTDKEAAIAFKKALEDAHKLIGNTSFESYVSIKEQGKQ